MIPVAFQGRRILRNLNVAAVGFALAALVGATLGAWFSLGKAETGAIGIAVPTLFVGSAWAALLRWKKKVHWIRAGWLLSVPLAMLNAGISCAWVVSDHGFGGDGGIPLFVLFFLGATLGIIVWGPALVLTLASFGFPLARAQKLAERGLAGEEKGERIVGAMSLVFSVLGFGISLLAVRALQPPAAAQYQTTIALVAALGALTGGSAMLLAHVRELRRRRFVKEVEAGRVENYRIDATHEGKVLIRVTAMGEGYRVADFHEEVFELEPSGDAKRAVLGARSFRSRA